MFLVEVRLFFFCGGVSDSLAKNSHEKSPFFFFEVKARGKVGLVKSSVEIDRCVGLASK